jgi:hypothetical protein
MTCGKCRWLGVQPNKAGVIVVLKSRMYRCTAPIPELPPLPKCIQVGGHGVHALRWPPHPNYMNAKDGEGCAYFEKREKAVVRNV